MRLVWGGVWLGIPLWDGDMFCQRNDSTAATFMYMFK